MKSTVTTTPDGYVIEEYKVRIKLVNGEKLFGTVNIATSGAKRLSDMFVLRDDPFLIMYDSTSGGTGTKGRVMFVNKSHILWAEPVDEE